METVQERDLIEATVRNLAFMIVILRMINVVNEQGTFWVTNNFIWGWLLIPVLALGELIKRDCAEDSNNIRKYFRGYMTLTTFFVLFWIVTIPLWKSFLFNIMRVQNPSDIFYLQGIFTPSLAGIPVLFGLGIVFDSLITFYLYNRA